MLLHSQGHPQAMQVLGLICHHAGLACICARNSTSMACSLGNKKWHTHNNVFDGVQVAPLRLQFDVEGQASKRLVQQQSTADFDASTALQLQMRSQATHSQ